MRLQELDILKFWGILLVVLGHVCAMYSPPPLIQPLEHSRFLFVVNRAIYSFHMPMFVFVSGCVYSYQCENLKCKIGITAFVKKKTLRLLIPYIAFGILLVLFMKILGLRENVLDYAINGIFLSKDSRHLWFVLMLFEVFMIFYVMNKFVDKLRLPKWSMLLVSFVFYLLANHFPYVFQISNSFRYLFWFSFGYIFLLYRANIKKCVFYIICSVVLYHYLADNCNLAFRIPFSSTITSIAGILFFFQLSCDWKSVSNCIFFRLVSNNSFGIYLYHVFFVYFFFHLTREIIISPYLLSLSVFFLSLLFSILLTILTRKIGLHVLIGERMSYAK